MSGDNTVTRTKQAGVGENVKIQQLFKLMVESGASDLHLTVGTPPGLRVNGDVVRVKIPALTAADSKRLIYQVLSEEQKNEFEKTLELDFSFGIKSTTLAALIDRLNENESGHIITLEDPVEFVHPHKQCIVNQREIGSDSLSFKNSLKSLLRQDPDIVLVGELRDPETIEAALTIAETGHLVFGTLHTNSAVQTINRVINVFPSHQQGQVRTLLSFVLQGVISQQLLPKSFEPGRCMAMEILVPTPGIRNLIREDKIHQLYSQMQIGQDKTGMTTMNQSLRKHFDAGLIDAETAMSYSTAPEELAPQLGVKTK